MRRVSVIVALAILALVGVWFVSQSMETARLRARERSGFGSGVRIENVESIFGGADALKILARPDRVTAERISPPESETPRSWSLGDYRATSQAIAVPSNMVEPLTSALASPDSYRWKTTKSCIPRFGVRLSF